MKNREFVHKKSPVTTVVVLVVVVERGMETVRGAQAGRRKASVMTRRQKIVLDSDLDRKWRNEHYMLVNSTGKCVCEEKNTPERN